MSALNDLGSLQGLITLSIGALVSIKVLNLRIRVGNTAIIKGNDNVVQFITNNFYANNENRLSFGFRCLLLMLVLSCVYGSMAAKILGCSGGCFMYHVNNNFCYRYVFVKQWNERHVLFLVHNIYRSYPVRAGRAPLI